MEFLWEKRKRPLCPPLILLPQVLIPFLILHVNDSYYIIVVFYYILYLYYNEKNERCKPGNSNYR